MFSFIYAEMLKMKKSKVILGLAITSVILPAFWLVLSLFSTTSPRSFEATTREIEDITFLILETLVFILLSNYVFVKEYYYGTENIEYIYPVNRVIIYSSKLLTNYMIMSFIYIIYFIVVFLGLTFTIGIPDIKKMFFSHFKAYMISILLQFYIVPIMVVIGNMLKRYVLSICSATFIFLLSCLLFFANKYKYWPFIFQYIPIFNADNIGMKFNIVYLLVSSLIIFLVTFLLGAFQFSYMDEKHII
ncbi:ABC transporter permease [Clostridium hydrogenum]|uniref:ABC transporter permease n=1 Tax=Clostridium hydrogenum TaxID=2855764 RepID=UPI001F4778D7|nr:ABC transporter permease [Clostridium hydrogenum]